MSIPPGGSQNMTLYRAGFPIPRHGELIDISLALRWALHPRW
ncbi:hypothetical protein L843_5459 [Mycobacterium intracellulare MIN_061107_1834]|nr:hypothetical protein L843_5459 [Mycobacterium intracellulare MIN_061107_1834]